MEAHVYQRQVDLSSGDSLALIARRVTSGAQVLELGVATGYFSRFLTEQLNCQVDGVELSPEMADQASPWCRQLLQADLEQVELADSFASGAYDFIICADILEHLRDPARVLTQLPQLLKVGGKVIISVPNVAYAGLILDLIGGNFEYRAEGLLDRSHLRFFTRTSFLQLLQGCGFEVKEVEPVRLPFEQSEFFGRLDQAPVPLKNYLFVRPDSDAYQFIIVAIPGNSV